MKRTLFSIISAVAFFIIAGNSAQAAQVNIHTISKGDSLWKISNTYGVSVNNLKAWNNLSSNTIYVGKTLNIQNNNGTAKVSAARTKAAPVQTNSVKSQKPAGKQITVQASAYTANCKGCSGITATGVNLKANPNAKVIAVDPSVIPLGSKVYVEGYGYATAADTGGAIKGNKIDVFIPTQDAALNWGRKQVNIQILN